MNKKIINHRDEGFTLIELLVVIAIIGLLSSIVLASLNSARQKAVNAGVVRSAQELRNAVELYAADNSGAYPGEDHPQNSPVYNRNSNDGTIITKNPSAFNLKNSLEPYIDENVILDSPIINQQYTFFLKSSLSYRCAGSGTAPRYVILLGNTGGFESKLPFLETNTGAVHEGLYCLSGPFN